MKRSTTICFYAALMGSAPAWAQSAVTVYGVLDEGVEYVRGVSVGDGSTAGQYRLGYGVAPSRLGFRGNEELGGGLNAVFALESGIMLDTGAQSQARLFGRQAFVGLTGKFGSLTFGRQYTMRYYGMLDADIFAAASQGLGSLDSGIPNARADNAVSYRGSWGAFSGGVNLSLGRDAVSANNPTATNCPGETAISRQCREWSAMLKYDGGNWGLAGAYERQYGGSAATYGGLVAPELRDARLTLNGYMKLRETRLGAGWLKRDNEGSATPKSNLYWLVGERPVSEQVVVSGMLAMNKFEDSPNKAVLFTVRGSYLLSRRSSLYLSASVMHNSGTLASPVSTNPPGTASLPGGSEQSLMVGIRHVF